MARKKKYPKTVAGTIRKLREEKGWSQRQLAKKARVSHSVISATERDESFPRFNTLERIANALGLTTWGFMDKVRSPKVDPTLRRMYELVTQLRED
jgi:transcriptional regulator with XRE-family HTH domain